MYAFVQKKKFTTAPIPKDLQAKREKLQARAEKKVEEVEKPKKVDKGALAKKIQAQLKGIDLLETLTNDLVRLGIGNMNAKTAAEVEEQAKQLGNAYLHGAQSALHSYTSLFAGADGRFDAKQTESQREAIFSEALDQLGRLHSLVKQGRAYLQRRLEDPELAPEIDSSIAAWLGHAWQLRELKDAGLVENDVELVQLTFNMHDDVARREFVETNSGTKKQSLRQRTMVKKKSAEDNLSEPAAPLPVNDSRILRAPAEVLYAEEIEALIKEDKHDRPPGWQMSARSVLTYICGGKCGKLDITPKYIGHERLVEIAISTLVTDRSLLLIGEPGTAKSWLSEHLAAAVNGDSTKVVQGTAGTTEEQIRYSWNYAMLIAHGPSHEALIKSPIFRAMESGSLARFEEVTRCASEVQDAMISRLSEKRLSVPELETEIPAAKGFSVIATANTRDRGVNDMSAALKRRFNIIVLPTPNTLETEMDIVRKRVGELAVNLDLKAELPAADAIEKVVTIFRELRLGQTLDGKNKLKTPSGVLSTAEAISVLANSMALAGHFGSGEVTARDIAAGLQGSVVKDEAKDKVIWDEYLANVMKKRGADWRPLYTSCTEHNS